MEQRMYDPAIARWMVQDPVVHHSKSPYNAFDNNPVYFADPSGADSESSNEGSGSSQGSSMSSGNQDGGGSQNGTGNQNGEEETIELGEAVVIGVKRAVAAGLAITVPKPIVNPLRITQIIGSSFKVGAIFLTRASIFGSMFVLQGDRPRDRVVNIDDGLSHLSDEEVNSEYEKLKGRLSKEEKAYKQRLKTEQKYRGGRNKEKRNEKKKK